MLRLHQKAFGRRIIKFKYDKTINFILSNENKINIAQGQQFGNNPMEKVGSHLPPVGVPQGCSILYMLG